MKRLIILLSFGYILLISNKSYSQWQQTEGPSGGSITCMASSGAYVFAGR